MIDRTESLPDIPEPSDDGWLTVAEAAEADGVGPRTMSRRAAKAAKGIPSRGVLLEVRVLKGRGQSGKNYKIKASSLPSRNAVQIPAVKPDATAAERKDVLEYWDPILCEIAQHPERSFERANAIVAVAARHKVSKTAIYHRLARYEGRTTGNPFGKAGNRLGDTTAFVTRKWDRAMRKAGFGDETLARISDELAGERAHQWQARGTRIGWRRIAFGPNTKEYVCLHDWLMILTREAGWTGDERTLRRMCRPTKHFTERERVADRMVATHDRDPKAHHDTQRRHALRDWSVTGPAAWYSFDVNHMDLALMRPDGSMFTGKLIALLDCGTGRLRAKLFLLEPGRSVARMQVAQFVAETFADAAFGVPLVMQVDNGSEFGKKLGFLHTLNPLFASCYEARTLRAATEIAELADGSKWRNHGVTFSAPHNPQSKPIEPAFQRLNGIISEDRAHIDGNRMKQTSKNRGQRQVVFQGGARELFERVDGWVSTYNATPFQNSRSFGNRSPNEVWNEHVQNGFEPYTAPVEATLALFAGKREERKASQGLFPIDNVDYALPDGFGRGAGKVIFRRFHWNADAVMVETDDGRMLLSKPASKTDPRSSDGTAVAAHGDKEARRNVIEARAKARPLGLDRVPEHLLTPDAPLASDSVGEVHIRGDIADIGKALAKTPKQRKADEEEKALETARRMIAAGGTKNRRTA